MTTSLRSIFLWLLLFAWGTSVHAAGVLEVKIVAGYNFVVDSNVTSPSSYAPEVATIMGNFCNIGDAQLTQVQAFIGDATAATPGLYPIRDSSLAAFATEHPQLVNTGLYSLTHIGALVDASRYVGVLDPGECSNQYWHLTYPRRGNPNNSGAPVWGASNIPDDDLWLEYDMWVTSSEGASDSATNRATMRNEISANANKIYPNGGSWFNTNTDTVEPGETVTTNGVNYNLGLINKGFDNDGDLDYDYNAWLQPIGDSSYDPTCFRLIRTWGKVTINRSGGNPDLVIPFEDQLYFTDLPPDNTGGTGEVHYEFLALRGTCSIGMTPYQEVASGADNEKFAGDYGAGLPPVGSDPAEVTFTKDVDLSETTQGGTLSYTLEVTNTGTLSLGLPDIGMPLVFKDSVPPGTTYVGGTASLTLGYAPSNPAFLLYSDDNGATWSSTEPVPANTVTDIQWWLADPLPPGGSATADFDLLVDNPYVGSPFVENRGEIGLGGASPMAEDSAVTLILGSYSIGDSVWRDDDADGVVDGGEPGFEDITVELYWDKNGDGKLDAGDVLVRTAVTTATGTYSFTSLPGGDYLVRVDTSDPDLPFGYSHTTDRLAVVADLGGTTTSPHNDADFGFVPSILLTKTLVGPDPALESDLVTFDIAITNNRGLSSGCETNRWAPAIDTSITSSWTNQNLLVDDASGPNGTYAYAGFGVANPGLGVNGFDFGGESGTIQKVEIHLPLYLSGTLSNDFVEVRFPDDLGTVQTVTLTTAELNNYAPQSNAGTLILDVTSLSSWTFADINAPTFYIEIENEKAQNEDGPELFLDAIGIFVTADQCSGPGAGTLSPVPLIDVYDADLLEFVSSTVTPTSVTFGSTPFTNTGTVSWGDVGPIATAQTQTIQVTFRALQPPDTNADSEPDPATTVNTATTSGAYYLSGDPANSATDTENVTINPAGSIGDVVYADNGSGTAGNGVQDIGEPGIPGVTVELWSDPDGNGNPVDGALLQSQITGASGDYLFDGLVDGNYVVVVLPGTLPGATFTQSADPDELGACVTCDDRGGTNINSNNGGPANDDDLTLDFGYMIPNTVFGNVWNDHDGDGVQDAGENGLASVTVDLLDCGADTVCGNGDDGATRSTTTDSLGEWLISDLPDGNYQAVVNTATLPAGGTWSQTVDPDATLDDRTTATLILANGVAFGCSRLCL